MRPACKELQERVQQFKSCKLPGQPLGLHMGTLYLINDLLKEVEYLTEHNALLKNALWKACGDDEESVNSCIESQRP